jgi:hypothetical protein
MSRMNTVVTYVTPISYVKSVRGAGKMAQTKDASGAQVNTGWLHIIEAEPPRYCCPVMETELTGPCNIRGCPLWTSNQKVYCCVGAFAGMKAANSEERLQATSATQREKRGTLRSAADGKLSFYDMAYMYGFTRQRVEGFVSYGRQVMETLTPLFSEVDVSSSSSTRAAKKRLGSPNLFTHTTPVSYTDPKSGDTTRVCICCESIIDSEDEELVMAILDKSEVAWCSRECAREFPIDAYLISNRYKRHWTSVALEKDEVDERSRVREITQERMVALKELAIKQGYF